MTVDGQLISTISKGLLVFAAIGKDDTVKEAESMASKVLKVKLWEGENGTKWKSNVQDIDGEVLCGSLGGFNLVFHILTRSQTVSQFTLLATVKKNSPSFHHSATPVKGKELYDAFISQVRSLYHEDKVKDGVFQAMMDVGIVNDGPVGVDYRCEDEAVLASPARSLLGGDEQCTDFLIGDDRNRDESAEDGQSIWIRAAKRRRYVQRPCAQDVRAAGFFA